MESEKQLELLKQMYLIDRSHCDIVNHMVTLLMKSQMQEKPVSSKDIELCREWIETMNDDFLYISDLLNTHPDFENIVVSDYMIHRSRDDPLKNHTSI